jgi:beta-glucosidase
VPFHYYTDDALFAANNGIAEQLAEESAVLLKNENIGDVPALPLNKDAEGMIMSLGMGATRLYRGGTGSGSINMTAEAAARLEQLPDALGDIVGDAKILDTNDLARVNGLSEVASITASGAMSSTGARNELYFTDERFLDFYNENLSAIIYVLQRESGEGTDIRVQNGAYYLSDAEQRLIAQGSELAKVKGIPFVVLFNTGSWVEMESWKDKPNAIIQCWNTGQVAGTPMAKLLFGDANPSGKLPTTIPKDVVGKDENGNFLNPSEGQFAKSNANGNGVTYLEGVFVGYRYYDAFDVQPSYPFGYGLSYTSFGFSGAKLSKDTFAGADDTIEASITVTNNGARAGKEVAQF